MRDLASELGINPRTVSQAYQELEREGVVYVKRGQGTFVAPVKRNSRERHNLARAVAKRTLIDARRSGLDVGKLIATLKEVAAEEEGRASSGIRRGVPEVLTKGGRFLSARQSER